MSKLHSFFAGKTVLVTGAASGIGNALANAFAQLGCKLAICDIDNALLEEVRAKLKAAHTDLSIHAEVLDVSDEHQWQEFLANCAEKLDHIDIVINNAGIEGSAQPVWATDNAVLKRVMDVNFYGMAYGSKAALPYLASRPWAALVNVSSIFGLVGPPNTADYTASKFAIRGYTESLRAELEIVHPQVQVHLVHPGGINTNITRLEHSQKFKHRFLTTKPEAIALHIAESIMLNKARIVFGNQAKRTHLASKFLPLKWLSKLVGKEIEGLAVEGDYNPDHTGFKLPK